MKLPCTLYFAKKDHSMKPSPEWKWNIWLRNLKFSVRVDPSRPHDVGARQCLNVLAMYHYPVEFCCKFRMAWINSNEYFTFFIHSFHCHMFHHNFGQYFDTKIPLSDRFWNTWRIDWCIHVINNNLATRLFWTGSVSCHCGENNFRLPWVAGNDAWDQKKCHCLWLPMIPGWMGWNSYIGQWKIRRW